MGKLGIMLLFELDTEINAIKTNTFMFIICVEIFGDCKLNSPESSVLLINLI